VHKHLPGTQAIPREFGLRWLSCFWPGSVRTNMDREPLHEPRMTPPLRIVTNSPSLRAAARASISRRHYALDGAADPCGGAPASGHGSRGDQVLRGHPIDRILILTVAGLGDFILGTPAIRAVRQHFGTASIWIVTIPEVRELAERCPYVDSVRALDLRGSRSAWRWTVGPQCRDFWGLVRELRGQRFDLVLNLYEVSTWTGALRMAALLSAIRAGKSVGRSSGGRGVIFDHVTSHEDHEADAQLSVARMIGSTSTDGFPEVWVTGDDRQASAALLERYGVDCTERLACLHPGAAEPRKRWPSERFAAVGQRLASLGARVVLVGAEEQRDLCTRVAQAIPGAISLAGETPLPVLAALLETTALVVSNDSGPMHVAAALGIPLVVPFGPGPPGRFAPRGRGIAQLLSSTGQRKGRPWWDGVPMEAVADAAVRLYTDPWRQHRPA